MGWRNRVGFAVRNAIPWSLPAFKRVVSRDAFAAELSLEARTRLIELEARTPIPHWRCSRLEFQESAYLLDVLAQHFGGLPLTGRGLEVGAKSGACLPALATFHPGGWDLVELDAHRRFSWGATRRAYGERLARDFPNCRYIAGDVLDIPQRYGVIVWLLPFLFPEPLDAWGLPSEKLMPERLLAHVHGLLEPGGVMLIVNQGDDERAEQRILLEKRGATFDDLGRIASPISPYRKLRYGFRVRKP